MKNSSLTLVRQESPEVLPSLSELANTASREHRLVLEAGTAMIEHAFRAGDALLAARNLVPHGEWEDWMVANLEQSVDECRLYMRIARYKDLVRHSQATTLRGAERLLAGKRDRRLDPTILAEVQRLRAEGASHREIAANLKISQSAVQRLLNPKSAARARQKASRRTMAGRRALRRKQRDQRAKQAGGEIAEGYALTRRALESLARANTVAVPAARRHIQSAMNRMYAAEDEIVKAIGLEP